MGEGVHFLRHISEVIGAMQGMRRPMPSRCSESRISIREVLFFEGNRSIGPLLSFRRHTLKYIGHKLELLISGK